MESQCLYPDRKICSHLNASGLSADSLRHFLAVAETQSFTNAADSLGLEVASVSRKIKGLEERLGARLFVRSPGKVTLTPSGAFLLERTRIFLPLSQKLVNEIRRLDEGAPPTIRIAYVGSATLSGQLQMLKSELLKIEARARFECHEEKMDIIPKLVQNECVDFGIVRATHEEFHHLDAIRLTEENFCIALQSDHRLVDRVAVSARELETENFILPEQRSGTFELAALGGFEPNCVAQPGTLLNVLSEVCIGHGIAIVPEVVKTSILLPNIVYRSISENISKSSITALFRPKNNTICVENLIAGLVSRIHA